jgi:fatty acid desaturase/predicted heme/steroid binding protein
MTSSVVLRAPASHPDGGSVARKVRTAAGVGALALCASGIAPWWALLPLWVVTCELVAAAYDARFCGLGVCVKKPSPKSAFLNPDRAVTWQELAEHNAADSAWIAVDGAVYDVTEFVDRHPGGREMLLLSVGREATDLFNSYHPFTDAPRAVLHKYRIGKLVSFEHPLYKPDSGFYREATAAVKAHFESRGVDPKNPWTGVVRMAPVYVLGAAVFALTFCTRDVPIAVRIAGAVLLGCCQGMPLTGWMHDASHASIGHSETWWWAVGRFSLDYISGSSMLSWRNQHVIGHHIYTNVMGADPDLPVSRDGDPRRLVPEQVWKSMYRFQHLYLPPLYGILALKSRFQDAFQIFPSRQNGPIRVNPISVQDHLRMLTAKVVWFFYRVIVPLTFFPAAVTPTRLACLFLITEFLTGYWLSFNFQVSHVSEHADFLFSDVDKRVQGLCPAEFDEEWAKTQVTTTVDYGHDCVVPTYLSGALNYQSVHHLFPTVSQYHYPAITPVVMSIARKHGIEFNVLPDFSSAFLAHVQHLKDLGQNGKAAELKME